MTEKDKQELRNLLVLEGYNIEERPHTNSVMDRSYPVSTMPIINHITGDYASRAPVPPVPDVIVEEPEDCSLHAKEDGYKWVSEPHPAAKAA